MEAAQQPQPTEKAQIVVAYTTGAPSLVLRYSKVDDAKKVYKKLREIWKASHVNKYEIVIDANCTMFDANIRLDTVCSIAFVDHAKRAKFIPIP